MPKLLLLCGNPNLYAEQLHLLEKRYGCDFIIMPTEDRDDPLDPKALIKETLDELLLPIDEPRSLNISKIISAITEANKAYLPTSFDGGTKKKPNRPPKCIRPKKTITLNKKRFG